MSKHSPTPWKHNGIKQKATHEGPEDWLPVAIWTEDAKTFICTGLHAPGINTQPSAEVIAANMEHIVRCVNSHDALVDALIRAVQHAESSDDYDWIGAAEEALDCGRPGWRNVTCKDCGRNDLPLHTDMLCPNCHSESP